MTAEEYLQSKGCTIEAIRHPQDLNKTLSEIDLFHVMESYHEFKLKSSWVSVEDRLPEEDGFYNVYAETDDNPLTHSLHFNVQRQVWLFDNYTDEGEPTFSTSWYLGVTHWQPLPQKP